MRSRLSLGPAPRRKASPTRWFRWALLVVALSIGAVRFFFFELVQLRGNTMAPTLLDGDVALVSLRDPPQLGDVVLVERGGRTVVRRVLGLPGDVMAASEGVLTRNELPRETRVVGLFSHHDPGGRQAAAGLTTTQADTEKPDERPLRQRWLRETLEGNRAHGLLGDYSGAAVAWTLRLDAMLVEPGQIFVLCDNRPACPLDDTTGPIPATAIRGVLRSAVWYGRARGPEATVEPGYGAFAPLSSGPVDAERAMPGLK
jgi:signal peptidase I